MSKEKPKSTRRINRQNKKMEKKLLGWRKEQGKKARIRQKPIQDMHKSLEEVDRKLIKKQIKHAPTEKEVEGQRKKGAKKHHSGLKRATKEGLKYKQRVLKDKSPELLFKKPKTITKKKIKADLLKRNIGKVAKKVLKASANPWLLAAEIALSPSSTQGVEHDKAVKERNEAWAKKTGNKSKSKIIGKPTRKPKKNYAHGGSVRKAKFTDS